MTRNGKIARLPREIREELNRRLERNIPGVTLVEWLNSLPEVQEVMANLFEGKPISPQNLSEWRQGGFAEWQFNNDFLFHLGELAASSETIEACCGSMADHAARLLAAKIALVLAKPSTDLDFVDRLKYLTPLIRSLSLLRRGDHSAARLKMEQQKLELARKDRAARDAKRSPGDEAAAGFPASPSSTPAAPPIPDAAKTQSNQIKPLSSEIVTETSEPEPSASTPADSSAEPAPVSNTEPGQRSNHPLPDDPEPAWRIQLPLNNGIPPWQSHSRKETFETADLECASH